MIKNLKTQQCPTFIIKIHTKFIAFFLETNKILHLTKKKDNLKFFKLIF